MLGVQGDDEFDDKTDEPETTLAPVTVTPKPDNPPIGNWSVMSDDKKTVCIILKQAAIFSINYTDSSKNVVSTCFFIFNLNKIMVICSTLAMHNVPTM